jgi:hypothetical protein
VVSVCLLEILPSHPPKWKPFAREPAPGSEVVWRKRGLGEIRNGLRDLLRAAAVRGLDSIAEGFMRSIVENEHDHALRFAKHFLGGGFYQGHLTISTHSTRRARWSFFNCASLGAQEDLGLFFPRKETSKRKSK